MIGWLLDTNVATAIINPNGAPSVKAWANSQPEQTFYLSILTLAELDKGIHNLEDADPNRTRFTALRGLLEARFADRLLSVSDPIVRRWGEISGKVRRATGHPAAVIDTLLAATALEHDLFLATRNTKDVLHSGAMLFDPWSQDPAQFPIVSRFSAPRRPPPA